jgi:DNA-binding NtrC family response regulator
MSLAKILIIDDEQAARYGMKKVLKDLDYYIFEASDSIQALEIIGHSVPDVILCDINMPNMDGIEFLKQLQTRYDTMNKPLVIMITAYGSERIAVEAMKAGAYDYLSKPYEIDDLRLTVKKALEKLNLVEENIKLKSKIEILSRPQFIGQSESIMRVLNIIDKVAPTDVTVLITGESGTGKELVAQTIHQKSPRHKASFISMNCAAIPKDLVESELFGHEKGAFTGATSRRNGKFEIADGGTLFLDEIGDMSLETQAKILRVLEEKAFMPLGGKDVIRTDVRLISATNKDLTKEIAAGNFREDLYYRLNVIKIPMPGLAERREDIPLLANHFLEEFALKHGRKAKKIEAEAMQALYSYNWPGNVRQLRNLLEQCVVLAEGEYIKYEYLPKELREFSSNDDGYSISDSSLSFTETKKMMVERVERKLIEKALTVTRGNVSQAAKRLRMKRQFLQQKMQALGISPRDFKKD